MNHLTTLATAITMLMGTVLAVQVAEAANLSLRTGPGNQYPISNNLTAGQSIKIGVCNPAWCHVSVNGVSGWTETRSLISGYSQASYRKSAYGNAVSSGGGSGGGSYRSGGTKKASASLNIRLEIDPNAGAEQQQQNYRKAAFEKRIPERLKRVPDLAAK